MPQSLILKLTAQSAIAAKYQQGYALQRLFFELVEAVDSSLGRLLQSDLTNRSYSLSTLQPALAPQPKSRAKLLQYNIDAVIPAQTQCWWRITFLDDLLFESVASLWQGLQNEAST